ncbi:SGNH/GDSL hydrolase family protein [Pseudonocardia xishanensis]|uniref:GDSL-like lipase/acylhydrolase family protein n=1 Tax=Pseudonocardia xishanensis TaxID=630995 RepID=A0ABP8RG26_9PSEU
MREQSVGRVAAKMLDAEKVLSKAKARLLVSEVREGLSKVADFEPDLVILSSGNVEAFVHPHRVVEKAVGRFGPTAWKGDVGMDPRPYFSTDPEKAREQLRESRIKVAVKNVLVRPFGGYTRMALDEYVRELTTLLDELERTGAAVVLLGPSKVSPYYFPYSDRNLARFERAQREIVATRARVRHISVRDLVPYRTEQQADLAHPDVAGHARLARAVVATVRVEERAGERAPEPATVA